MAKKTPQMKDSKGVTIDLNEIYKFEPKDITIDITTSRYSNLAYVTCEHRDVFIDFLEMPGIKKDGKMMVNGTRIFMSHAAAQKLAEALKGILKQIHDDGQMESYNPDLSSIYTLSAKVTRSKEDKQI
ncbi:MAG: DUF3467 domain-containing protein [Methanoregula sp.]|jgi:hypothetical protein|nr:DUF3467 domain-containing protein [Methanoregula sp.]